MEELPTTLPESSDRLHTEYRTAEIFSPPTFGDERLLVTRSATHELKVWSVH